MKPITRPQVVILDPFLSTRDVAQYIGRSEETICRWVRTGRLRARRTPTGDYIFKLQDIEDALEPVEIRAIG